MRFDKEEYSDLRSLIAADLDRKINLVIEGKLQEWFDTNLKEAIEKGIKEEFEKIMIVKLK